MNPVTGLEAGRLFRSAVKDQRRIKQSPEFTYTFIQEAFKALAKGEGSFQIGEKQISVDQLGIHDLKALCKLSKKFFESQKNLTVSGELLSNIEKVKQNKQFTICFSDANGNKEYVGMPTKKLDSIKELIFLYENLEVESGACESLQKELRDEIKSNASILKKMRGTAKVKKAAFLAAGVVGSLGSFVGGILLMATGVTGPGGLALMFFGIMASVATATGGVMSVKSKLKRTQQAQDERIWAFELLKNEAAFQVFCQERGLDPQSVTVGALLKNRYKKVEVPKE
jgi:hypothetical protein